ncbi:hypothetical protein AAHC03_026348 [Spirometra sp. Aus1]
MFTSKTNQPPYPVNEDPVHHHNSSEVNNGSCGHPNSLRIGGQVVEKPFVRRIVNPISSTVPFGMESDETEDEHVDVPSGTPPTDLSSASPPSNPTSTPPYPLTEAPPARDYDLCPSSKQLH